MEPSFRVKESMNEPSDLQSELWHRGLQRLRTYARGALPFVSGVIASLAGLLLYTFLVPAPTPLTQNDVNDTVAQALASATPAPAYSELAYQAIQPALVFIQVHAPGLEDDEEEEDGLGSGVVINADGAILTSLHVVTNATEIQLTFADGTEAKGQIIATQPENDIAVLGADRLPEVLIPAVLGNPNAMRVGDEAFAVGHPFGLYGSMTSGVISGFERTFRPQNSGQRLQGLIQIDAAVNPGNSGGPLLNRYGQVVGIVTGLANPTDDTFFIGIGFAVPIDVAGGAAGLPPY
jgi:S1-C subfamily serine protease